MEFKYYVQEYAKERAARILPVPNNYPLRGDFGLDFYSNLKKLAEILRTIYLDVAENPAVYGCELYSLDNEVRGRSGADNESNLSLDRIVKCLRTFCDCGEIENHVLKVKSEQFKKQIKNVSNYSAVIEKIKDFGFAYQGDIKDKSIEFFYVLYPQAPIIIDILKIYMDCWNEVLVDEYLKSEIKKNGYGWIAGYYDFYLFDYKVTANPKKLDPMQLIKDNCYSWDKNNADTYTAFFEYSKKYPEIRFFNHNYFIRRNRVAIFRYNDKQKFLNLKLKLKNPGKYMYEIERLPKHLQEYFSDKAMICQRCGCLGNNPDTCKNRILWKFDGIDYVGCSMECFYFNNIENEDILRLFALLEFDYGIKKID